MVALTSFYLRSPSDDGSSLNLLCLLSLVDVKFSVLSLGQTKVSNDAHAQESCGHGEVDESSIKTVVAIGIVIIRGKDEEAEHSHEGASHSRDTVTKHGSSHHGRREEGSEPVDPTLAERIRNSLDEEDERYYDFCSHLILNVLGSERHDQCSD